GVTRATSWPLQHDDLYLITVASQPRKRIDDRILDGLAGGLNTLHAYLPFFERPLPLRDCAPDPPFAVFLRAPLPPLVAADRVPFAPARAPFAPFPLEDFAATAP